MARVRTYGPDDLQAVGTTRRIDQLGRIVVPAELRKILGVQTGDLINCRFVDGHIALMKVDVECALCARRTDLVERNGKHICDQCIRALREEPECAICGRVDALVEQHGKHLCDVCVREIRGVNEAV